MPQIFQDFTYNNKHSSTAFFLLC